MKEETIAKVASVLETWNPLGERAALVTDLDGYRIEAIDILSTINIMKGENKVERATKQVLSQAFHIDIEDSEAAKAAIEIQKIIDAE